MKIVALSDGLKSPSHLCEADYFAGSAGLGSRA